MALAEEWLVWNDAARSPSFNMAADQAMLAGAARRAKPLLRFYRWDRRAVSIGYVQSFRAAPPGFAVVRRPTGGGIVYHDLDFTWSIAFPPGHWLGGLERSRSYDVLNRALQSALRSLGMETQLSFGTIPHEVDRSRMVCFTNPTRYDLLLDGRKIAGSAQRRTAEGLLHQGSLHLGRPLPWPHEKIALALVAAMENDLKAVFSSFTPSPEFLGAVAEWMEKRYGTEEWNHLR